MLSNSLKIRPFNVGAAFEIILPNEKIILIDPWFTGNQFDEGYSREDVTGADYIIVTHTHFDHDMDVGYFVRKFGSKIFVGAMSAPALIKFHKIPYDNVVPVFPGQKFTLPDFTLQTWQSKHNSSGGRIYDANADIAKDYIGLEGHQECDDLGSMESLDIMITTNNNFRILMASGTVVWEDLFDICKSNGPNILLRQAGMREAGGDFSTGKQVEPKILAELLVKYHAQIIFPFHHDMMIKRWGKQKLDKYFDTVKQELQKLDREAYFISPEAWKWYNIGIEVSTMDGLRDM